MKKTPLLAVNDRHDSYRHKQMRKIVKKFRKEFDGEAYVFAQNIHFFIADAMNGHTANNMLYPVHIHGKQKPATKLIEALKDRLLKEAKEMLDKHLDAKNKGFLWEKDYRLDTRNIEQPVQQAAE